MPGSEVPSTCLGKRVWVGRQDSPACCWGLTGFQRVAGSHLGAEAVIRNVWPAQLGGHISAIKPRVRALCYRLPKPVCGHCQATTLPETASCVLTGALGRGCGTILAPHVTIVLVTSRGEDVSRAAPCAVQRVITWSHGT